MAIVYVLTCRTCETGLVDHRVTEQRSVHGSLNSAAMCGFHIVADWIDGNIARYGAQYVAKFQAAIMRQEFIRAFSIWNHDLAPNCHISITEEEIDDNEFTSQKVADEAMTLLFGDKEDNG